MPIFPATDPPRKQRAPIWAVVLATGVLPLAGVFGWSCYRPVEFEVGGHGVGLGWDMPAYQVYQERIGLLVDNANYGGGFAAPGFYTVLIPLSLGGGAYFVWWY